MSTIEVNKVTPVSGGTNLQIGESGDTTNLSAGSVTLPTSIITGQSAKTSLADADKFLISDSAASGAFKYVESQYVGGGGITEADSWRQHSNTAVNGTLDPISSNWERSDHTTAGYIGTGMTQSSGVFTFPSTGYYLVTFKVSSYGNGGAVGEVYSQIRATNNNSSYVSIAHGVDSNSANGYYGMSMCSCIVDVTNTTNVKVRFKIYTNASSLIQGNSTEDATSVTFVRLGDT